MAVVFSAREIVEAAVEKERKRKGFYARVWELSTDEPMKALFRFLTEEEERHVAEFTRIRDGLPRETFSDEYGADMQAYMDSVIDDRLYAKIDTEAFVRKAITSRDVFRLAIGFEKDAILYFREFLPYLGEDDRKVIEALIDQEKGHIRLLGDMEKKLAG